MSNADEFQIMQAIVERLGEVDDPETGAGVIKTRLVEESDVTPDSLVSYTFHPSSPLCPIAIFLAQQIKGAVADFPGVTGQQITGTGHVAAKVLTKFINKET